MNSSADAPVSRDARSWFAIRTLALSMLASTTGTNLILVALSIQLFMEKSSLAATGIYVAQFLPVMILMPVAWRICDRMAVRRALVVLECASAATTLLVGLAMSADALWLAYALLFVRGFTDMTTKAARGVAVKQLAPAGQVASANNLVNGASYVGQCLGALLGALLVTIAGPLTIACVNAGTFLASAMLCLLLPMVAGQAAARGGYAEMFSRAMAAFRRDETVRRAMALLVGTVVFLQGYNQVARYWIPLAWLELPAGAGALTEGLGLIGVIGGLLVVSRFFTGEKKRKPEMTWAFGIACIAMLLPFATQLPAVSLALYLAFMFLFEISFLLTMNTLLFRADEADVPCLLVLFYGLSFGGMAVVATLLAACADTLGLPLPAAGLCLLGACFAAWIGSRPGKQRIQDAI
ncbi:MFS transporter [Cereibacter sphaeroides]|uniref:MFS transporter n=1 Tax=Cereibacter sphaeroides TaxID=1063 RepID=UPI001F3BDA39|nr:MFS transporter [Cereibacter sphaeroides]MCE6958345.1 MFS transporter [Cereibacter sphaeroides]MCE6972212.1 MFS transporter [Cereibacter sphaeroides]